MAGDIKKKKVKANNRFVTDIKNTIIVYDEPTSEDQKSRYDFLNSQEAGEYDFPITISVVEQGKPSPSQCYIYGLDNAEYTFSPTNDVVVFKKKGYVFIPKNVTQWTLRITGSQKTEADIDKVNVTVGDEPPGDLG